MSLCRVCHGESEPGHELFYPCKCDGTIKYIHQDCLVEWLKHSKQKVPRCELCGHNFTFQNVYKEGAPLRLTVLELIKELIPRAIDLLFSLFSMLVAIFLWGMCLPLFANWWVRVSWCLLSDPITDKCVERISTSIFSLENIMPSWYNGVVDLCIIVTISFFLFEVGRVIFKEIVHLEKNHVHRLVEREVEQNKMHLLALLTAHRGFLVQCIATAAQCVDVEVTTRSLLCPSTGTVSSFSQTEHLLLAKAELESLQAHAERMDMVLVLEVDAHNMSIKGDGKCMEHLTACRQALERIVTVLDHLNTSAVLPTFLTLSDHLQTVIKLQNTQMQTFATVSLATSAMSLTLQSHHGMLSLKLIEDLNKLLTVRMQHSQLSKDELARFQLYHAEFLKYQALLTEKYGLYLDTLRESCDEDSDMHRIELLARLLLEKRHLEDQMRARYLVQAQTATGTGAVAGVAAGTAPAGDDHPIEPDHHDEVEPQEDEDAEQADHEVPEVVPQVTEEPAPGPESAGVPQSEAAEENGADDFFFTTLVPSADSTPRYAALPPFEMPVPSVPMIGEHVDEEAEGDAEAAEDEDHEDGDEDHVDQEELAGALSEDEDEPLPEMNTANFDSMYGEEPVQEEDAQLHLQLPDDAHEEGEPDEEDEEDEPAEQENLAAGEPLAGQELDNVMHRVHDVEQVINNNPQLLPQLPPQPVNPNHIYLGYEHFFVCLLFIVVFTFLTLLVPAGLGKVSLMVLQKLTGYRLVTLREAAEQFAADESNLVLLSKVFEYSPTALSNPSTRGLLLETFVCKLQTIIHIFVGYFTWSGLAIAVYLIYSIKYITAISYDFSIQTILFHQAWGVLQTANMTCKACLIVFLYLIILPTCCTFIMMVSIYPTILRNRQPGAIEEDSFPFVLFGFLFIFSYFVIAHVIYLTSELRQLVKPPIMSTLLLNNSVYRLLTEPPQQLHGLQPAGPMQLGQFALLQQQLMFYGYNDIAKVFVIQFIVMLLGVLVHIIVPLRFGSVLSLTFAPLTFRSASTFSDVQIPVEMILSHIFIPLLIDRLQYPATMTNILRVSLGALCRLLAMEHILEPAAFPPGEGQHVPHGLPGPPQLAVQDQEPGAEAAAEVALQAADADAAGDGDEEDDELLRHEQEEEDEVADVLQGLLDHIDLQMEVQPAEEDQVEAADEQPADAADEEDVAAPHEEAVPGEVAADEQIEAEPEVIEELVVDPSQRFTYIHTHTVEASAPSRMLRAVQNLFTARYTAIQTACANDVIPESMRLAIIVGALCMVFAVLTCWTLFWPLLLGRRMLPLLNLPAGNDVFNYPVGLLTCYLVLYIGRYLLQDVLRNAASIHHLSGIMAKWAGLISRISLASLLWITLPPMLVGYCFEMMVILPFRLSAAETPIFPFLQAWALGLIMLKLAVR